MKKALFIIVIFLAGLGFGMIASHLSYKSSLPSLEEIEFNLSLIKDLNKDYQSGLLKNFYKSNWDCVMVVSSYESIQSQLKKHFGNEKYSVHYPAKGYLDDSRTGLVFVDNKKMQGNMIRDILYVTRFTTEKINSSHTNPICIDRNVAKIEVSYAVNPPKLAPYYTITYQEGE